MAARIQIVIDAHDPALLAGFWAEALGYQEEPPPPGFDDWPTFLRSIDMPEDQWDRYAAVIDPDGAGPRVFFQKVPEGKVVKNRVHLDLGFSPRGTIGEERREAIARGVARLEGLGATVVGPKEEMGAYWVVMQDPEGNEFCVH